MRLIYHESIHFFVALAIAAFIYWRYKSWKLVFLVLGVSFLLDIDHLFDLMAAGGGLKDAFSSSYFLSSNKVYVFLHSWELLIPWWIYIIWTTPRQSSGRANYPLGWAVTLAFVGHLLVDQFSYGAYPLTYFLTYRIFHHFNLNQLFVIS